MNGTGSKTDDMSWELGDMLIHSEIWSCSLSSASMPFLKQGYHFWESIEKVLLVTEGEEWNCC